MFVLVIEHEMEMTHIRRIDYGVVSKALRWQLHLQEGLVGLDAKR
jgi:hypothetical protein